ncbi:MAG: Gfo/Idh/MocA family protein [Candidatus Poribacteria bacterium]
MTRTIKLGFIGCGGIANVHASNINKLENAEVIAWCDIAKERAAGFLSKFGGKYVTDNARDIFDDPQIDGVFILTAKPDDCAFMHAELGIQAAKAGKHIFIEKPIAGTLAEADDLVEAVNEAGVKFQLGFCFEYSPTIERAKKLMPNPAYSICQCAATLSGQACHNLDIIVHKFHDAQLASVYASGGKYFDFDNHLPIDSFAAVLKFQDGSTSSYVQHGTMNHKLNKFQFQLFGPEGCVFLGDRFRDVLWYPISGEPAEPYRDEVMYMGHFQEVEDFVKCIIEDGQPINTAERGRYVLAVEKAIIESATTGEVVGM